MILRELFAKLGLKVDEQSFAKGHLAAEGVKFALGKVVDVAKEAIDHFVEMTMQTAEAGHALEKMAQETGLTTDQIQNLISAATASGVSTDDLTGGLRALSREMYAAAHGGEEQSKAFGRLGVKTRDVHGKLRSASDVLLDLSDRFAKMPDGVEKTAQAMSVLGRNGASLIPLLNKGREEIGALANEFPNLTEEQIKASAELVGTQKQLAAVTASLWQRAIAPLLPAINALLKRYLAWRKANAAILAQTIQKYLGYAIKAVNALGTAFDFLVKNATAVKYIIAGLVGVFALMHIAAVAAAAGTLAAWLLAAAPFVLIAGLIAGIMLILDDIRVYEKGGKSLFGLWKKNIDEWLKPKDTDFWFVRQIKNFIQLIKDAMEEWEALQDALDPTRAQKKKEQIDKMAGAAPKEVQRRSDNTTIATARRRAGMGLELSDDERRALARQGIDEGQFLARHGVQSAAGPVQSPGVPPPEIAGYTASFAPEAPPTSGGKSVVINQGDATYNIHPSEGMDEDKLASMVKDQVEEHNATMWEEANAVASGN